MQNDDDVELNDILNSSLKCAKNSRLFSPNLPSSVESKEEAHDAIRQWTSGDSKRYVPACETVRSLPPAAYEIKSNGNLGIYFERIPINIDGLVRFPQANTDKVLSEIQNFWDKKNLFQEYNLVHKRGILMWGPPGSGKSCCIKFVMKDVIEKRGGIVVKFTHPMLFIEGMRILREIEPKTPVVVLMEDIDAIVSSFSESEVLNILDGVDRVELVVFLATTNYPELLGSRIVNRPSRFDKRFKIHHPNAQSRLIYFKHIICDDERAKNEGLNTLEQRDAFVYSKAISMGINLETWVNDTVGFSIAHLKELFVAVCILGDDYDIAIETLNSMKDHIRSADDVESQIGFFREEQDD